MAKNRKMISVEVPTYNRIMTVKKVGGLQVSFFVNLAVNEWIERHAGPKTAIGQAIIEMEIEAMSSAPQTHKDLPTLLDHSVTLDELVDELKPVVRTISREDICKELNMPEAENAQEAL